FALLGRTSALPHLHRFACRWNLYGSAKQVGELFRSGWCSRIHRLAVNNVWRYSAAALIEALPSLRELHTLEINRLPSHGFAALAGQTFPVLGRLRLGPDALPDACAELGAIAGVNFPRLAVLELPKVEWRSDQLLAVARSPAFERLRVLELDATGFGPQGLSVLAASPPARTLRVLRLSAPAFTPDDLVAIAMPDAFPNLSTLEVRKSRAVTTAIGEAPGLADALRDASWPHLRQLDMAGCPLGDSEVFALAANPSLANLRTLNLRDTGITGKGIAAVVSSPHFQNLVSLCLSGCKCGSKLEPLADPSLLPHLADCALPRDVPESARKRLRETRPGVFH
ncbi:MAG TPA: hypothetical protein VM529_15745, partial [Gemmata sp.]|nr:hypothetical protein [Gemmata sp.]